MVRMKYLFVTLLAGLILASCSPAPEVEVRYNPDDLRFDGDQAFAIEGEFVSRFPNRDSGQPNNRLAAEWLAGQFTGLGLKCRLDEWTIINYSRAMPMVNAVCRLEGDSPQEILIVAHHDQAPMTVEGANNDGSGIAAMLHLAEIFAAERPLPYTLAFVSTDGEEYGMLGSRRYIQTHPDTGSILAGISLDNLGRPYHEGLFVELTGQFRGYGAIWLPLAARAASQAGEGTWDVIMRSTLDQAIDQSVPLSFMDQGPMVAAGVPAVGFSGYFPPEYQAEDYALWHSPQDSMEHQSPVSLGRAGRSAEALVRQLLALQSFPRERGPYLYFDDTGQVLRGLPLMALFTGFVLVFFTASLLAGRAAFNPSTPNWRTVWPHFLSLWLPLVASVVLVYGLEAVGIMDKYHLFPATSKDPAVYNPRWPAVILYVGGTVLFFWLGRLVLRRLAGQNSAPNPASRRSFAYLVVGLAGLYSLAYNPFTLLLYLPLLFWLLVRGRQGAGKVLDLAFFLLGGLALYGIIYQFGFVVYDYNFAFLWFMLMMFASGGFSFGTLAVTGAIIAAGLTMIVTPPARAA